MASTYSSAYEAGVRIDRFRGINQRDGEDNTNPEYAYYAENCDLTGGELAPARAPLEVFEPLPAPIGTLARFHRRYYAPDGKGVLIAAAGGVLYRRTETGTQWIEIARGFQSDDWDYVTYEINPEGSPAPVDVLILTNAIDGMICIRGDNFTAEAVPTPKRFGVICRHAERIWGSGIEDDPDMLVYSAPYDPFDWTQNDEIPEDGAGDILQPSWDGDRFIALKSWGEYLLAFKRDTVWRVLGTDPGEYVLRQQYGEDGAIAENTIAIERDTVFMLYERGISIYDGSGVRPFDRGMLRDIFKRINREATGGATATIFRHQYLLALPLDGSAHNNAVVVYDTQENTWMLRPGIEVASFCPVDDRLFMTSPTAPGRTYAWGEGDCQPMKWVSAYQDMGAKDVNKNAFLLYLTAVSERDFELAIGITTEKKGREKIYQVQGGKNKTKRIRLGNNGRRWKLQISSKTKTPWRLVGGVQVSMETDRD